MAEAPKKTPLWMYLVSGAATLLFLFLLIGALNSSGRGNRMERVKQKCQEEFGSLGEERVNDCVIQVLAEDLKNRESDAMDRVRAS